MKPLVLVITGLPVLVLAATATFGPFRIDVLARGFEEHCVRLESGEAVHYRFRASGEVDFNIHHHRGSEVLYPVRTPATVVADGEFKAPLSDTYCLMWERKREGSVRIDGAVDRLPR
jgi:hypothetical protein